MGTQNICLYGEIRKKNPDTPPTYSEIRCSTMKGDCLIIMFFIW